MFKRVRRMKKKKTMQVVTVWKTSSKSFLLCIPFLSQRNQLERMMNSSTPKFPQRPSAMDHAWFAEKGSSHIFQPSPIAWHARWEVTTSSMANIRSSSRDEFLPPAAVARLPVSLFSSICTGILAGLRAFYNRERTALKLRLPLPVPGLARS